MSAKSSSSLFSRLPAALPVWTLLSPIAAIGALIALSDGSSSSVVLSVVSALLIAAVLAAVHHAEVVAHRVGEPYGSLVLAVAVTVIEVALIVSLMLAGGESTNALARDTVFSAIMIVCNGVLGLCILVGGWRHKVLAFRVEGTSPTLAVLAALSVLTLVLPAFTTSSPGPTFSRSQLLFAGAVSLVLYGAFVFVQAVRHRDYFLPVTGVDDQDAHAEPPSWRVAGTSVVLLLVCLVGVVGLAKLLAPTIERGVHAIGAPPSLVGVIVAMMVLLPETVAAVRAALHNRLQTSLNLALGSGLASIGLTIPTVAVLSPLFPHSLVLGLTPLSMVLLFLTFIVGGLTLAGGRATVLQGAVHMVVFVVFLFLAVVP
ncbi:ionic transporter y4hA [Roseateles aquatilis]|uniref:Ionic transporter y4hA n=1 Tax=Roseateles aquatilis TaxID=431061 RepID=A0A246J2M6_9BURK|nr:ionic transporter y4hA [Roseateles aquatilis]OWQ86813.1 ionic transporter y4hA [Roseateles aquatilis]